MNLVKPKYASSLTVLSCLGWIVFYLVSFAALGSDFPTINSRGAEIVDWFTAHGTRAKFYAWTSPFAALTLTVFGAMLAARLPRPHRYIVFGGVLMWAVTGMVQAWFWAGLAFRPDNLDPQTAEVLFVIPQFWGPIINGSTMTMALPFILLGFGKAPLIPRWLALLSLILFVEQGIETITVFGQKGFLAPGGAMNLYLGGVIGLAWVIGAMTWAFREWHSPVDES